jgi:Sec-independent protein translocase protein TatA
MGEITVILLLALIFLGPKKLPDLAAGLGKLIREIRKATSDVKNEIALDDTFRKPFEELRDAVTLHPDELKRRDRIKQEVEQLRRQAEEEAARAAAAAAPAELPPSDEGAKTPPPLAEVVPTPPPPAPLPPAPPPAAAVHVQPPPAPPWANASSASPPPPATGTRGGTPAAGNKLPVTPLGTVARQPIRRVTPPPTPPMASGPRVVPPISAGAAESANRTQVLSENDLVPGEKPPPLPQGAAPPPMAPPKKTTT